MSKEESRATPPSESDFSHMPASKMTTRDLISLFGEVAGRLAMYDTKAMHDRFWEIRRELEAREHLFARSEIAPIPDLAMLLREAVLKIELYAQNVGNVYIGGAPNQNLLPRLRAAADKLEGK